LLVEHRVLERMAAELARTGALDRMVDEALASPRTSELVDRVIASPELRRAVREIAASREVREAVAQQTTGFVEELAAEVRRWARRLDGRNRQTARGRDAVRGRRHARACPDRGRAADRRPSSRRSRALSP
jgi:hypothetical protein